MPKKKTNEAIEIKAMRLQQITIAIVGDTPLIVHNFSFKSRAIMLAKQIKVAWPKEPKDPVFQFEGGSYYIDDDGKELPCPVDMGLVVQGKVTEFIEKYSAYIKHLQSLPNPKFGFPAVGLKACAIRGCKVLGLTMTDMKGSFRIERDFVEIRGPRHMRSDMVRLAMSTADIRFRPEFDPWHMVFDVKYDSDQVTPDVLCNIFERGGFTCGIGEWRTQKDGRYGAFHVATGKEAEKLI